MKRLVYILMPAVLTGVGLRAEEPAAPGRATFVIVRGAAGEEAFGQAFAKQAALWEKAAETAGAKTVRLGGGEATEADRVRLEKTLADEPKEGSDALWLVLIGHGTFDKKEARFNLRGDDVSVTELAAWLQPFRRPVAVLNTTSASAPFLAKLSAAGRVVITATRSGSEQNYARFGEHLAPALSDPASDLDQDGQISLLEAFLAASAKVAEFYRTEGRLATEHALIDDNGDGLGTPADWFRGLRAVKKPKDATALDGLRAHQWPLRPDAAEQARPAEWRAQRDALEAGIAELREQKSTLPEADYYRRLEPLLLKLARLHDGGAARRGQ